MMEEVSQLGRFMMVVWFELNVAWMLTGSVVDNWDLDFVSRCL